MFEFKDHQRLISADYFDINGEIVAIEQFGSGHINDTFRVKTTGGLARDYLLQRINHTIFPDVEGLMNNINNVLNHLKEKLAHLGEAEVEKRSLTLIPTKSGALFYQDEEGGYWRMFVLLKDTKSYDIVETTKQAFSGGQAFGAFQKNLADLDPNRLVSILPNFHNIDFRLANLRAAIINDAAGRVDDVATLLQELFIREERMRKVLLMGNANEIPLRITHNDTKFNNVLLDVYDEVQCVIDLDTVMPGYIAYDFGDAIRTIINPAAEDAVDLDTIVLNIHLFEAYAQGYLQEASSFLTAKERESLIHGVLLLPYMQAVRFLTDYINGDTYYKIEYADHNLVRTKTQLKLVEELEKHESELIQILAKY